MLFELKATELYNAVYICTEITFALSGQSFHQTRVFMVQLTEMKTILVKCKILVNSC